MDRQLISKLARNAGFSIDDSGQHVHDYSRHGIDELLTRFAGLVAEKCSRMVEEDRRDDRTVRAIRATFQKGSV